MHPYKFWLTMTVCALCCFSPEFTGRSSTHVEGQLLKELPESARGIAVLDKVGEFVPLDLLFTDERGNQIGLGKFFKKNKPIILTLNYSDCPGLCIAQLDNLVANLREPWGQDLGERFEIVTVSIDPTEKFTKARDTKAKYVGLLRDTKAEESWHFLTGEQQQITKLANAVGFKYTYDKANKRYSHAAVTYFLSPDGRVCRYFVSLGLEPQQMKLAIAEAGKGKLNESISDSFIQMCYMYDPEANRYSADARSAMALGGGVFVLMLVGLTAPFWFGRAAKAPIAKSEGLHSTENSYIQSEANSSDIKSPNNSPMKDTHE
jgi:protein SCO1/2